MAATPGKVDAIARFRAAHAAFMNRLQSVPPAVMEEAIGQGWSPRGMAAHLAGGHEDMAAAAERLARGEPARPPGAPPETDDQANARFVRRFEGVPPAEVVAALVAAFQRCLEAFGALPESHFESDRGPGRWLLDECDHYAAHAAQLAAASELS